jgi:hypothetical protein
MITLYAAIEIQSLDAQEKKINPEKWYPVIGTLHRIYTKDGKSEPQDLVMVINDENKMENLFLSKLKVRSVIEAQKGY